mmetsp:Transcript_49539/g.146358  ORF Transcript_49539/g.146358 Transcript_49539/m.146358 type:complete len:267 (-) Transcript_49539:13-813(-)
MGHLLLNVPDDQRRRRAIVLMPPARLPGGLRGGPVRGRWRGLHRRRWHRRGRRRRGQRHGHGGQRGDAAPSGLVPAVPVVRDGGPRGKLHACGAPRQVGIRIGAVAGAHVGPQVGAHSRRRRRVISKLARRSVGLRHVRHRGVRAVHVRHVADVFAAAESSSVFGALVRQRATLQVSLQPLGSDVDAGIDRLLHGLSPVVVGDELRKRMSLGEGPRVLRVVAARFQEGVADGAESCGSEAVRRHGRHGRHSGQRPVCSGAECTYKY